MKRLLLLLLIASGLSAAAQPFNNEWIDYSKTYYKIKIGSTGLYRISQSMLTTMGIGGAGAQDFQLWRNGQQVALYTTVATGPLSSADFIEFWGEMNDGEPDNIMYRDADFQLNKKWSLQTDTAAFFLTVNPGGSNLRLTTTANVVPGGPAEPFFEHTQGVYFKARIGQGYAQVVGENVFSSAYDAGEGWASADIAKGGIQTTTMSNLQPYLGAGAQTPQFKIHASGYNGLNQRTYLARINGDSVIGQELNFFDYVKSTANFPLSLLSTGTATITVTNQANVLGTDRMMVAQLEIKYSRLFDFGGAANFPFSLPANAAGYNLAINSFTHLGVAPVLYDLTDNKRYVADMSATPVVKFGLPAFTSTHKLVLISLAPANVSNVSSFIQRNFVNYALPANQGNYLIITHPSLLNGSNGSHPVDDYKVYRSSAIGGGYNVKLYMIDELIDQFGLGIKKHPLSVRNFLRWARATYSSPLKNVLLVGKGLNYIQYRTNEANAEIDKLAIIPTFGHPASDMLLSANPGTDEIPQTPIGRLSVINGDEVAIYLTKVKQYEQTQAFQSPLIADKAWMKNVGHVVGASEEGLGIALEASMERLRLVIKDTFYGANVHTFSKQSSETIDQANSSRIHALFNEGMGLLTYFGHSSASTLEFNLDNPQSYENAGKYPLFILLGCNAGNFFNFNLARLQTKETISEKFVLAENRGSIATIASTHLGIVHYLDIYATKNYTSMSTLKYGETLGEVMREAIVQTFNLTTQNDYYARFHCEQATLHGDPAIRMNSYAKPDYVIEDQLVKINPSFISVAESSFKVNASFMNIGRAISNNIVVEVKRTYPNQVVEVIHRDTIPGIRYIDSLTYNVPIVATRDKGLNRITITVDADNAVDELYETNNSITKDVFIFEDEARPVFPYEYSIVNEQNVKLSISTADPFAASKDYVIEMDTTALYNSPLKITRNQSSAGGTFEVIPGITFLDSTVYYWRVAAVPTSGVPTWSSSSFIFIANNESGFNQSHYYQHLESDLRGIKLDRNGWKFDSITQNLFIRNTIFGEGGTQQSEFTIAVNDDPYIGGGCNLNAIIFNVFNPITLKPWRNTFTASSGLYQSFTQTCGPLREYNFEFSYYTADGRTRIMNFLNNIVPTGYIVVARSNIPAVSPIPPAYVNRWMDDTLVNGSGNSLYHLFKNQGFATIDSFNRARTWIFAYKKNDPLSFTPKYSMAQTVYDKVIVNADIQTPDSAAFVTSPLFGRAQAWKQLLIRGTSAPDVGIGDHPTVDIIGQNNAGVKSVLMTNLDVFTQNFDISAIDAAEYPYLQLRMKNVDTTYYTPYQLKYWRLTYDPVPEGVIAPNLFFQHKDTVDVGEPINFGIAFKNISRLPFDSVLTRLIVTNANNVATHIPVLRRRPMGITAPSDSIHITARILTENLSGSNTLFVEVNPDDDQPEQHHFNNFAFWDFYVRPDSLNPLLDVTFDGTHILNRDIVSSKPDIVIKLKDEAKWMILDNNNLAKVKVKFPDGNTREFQFGTDTLQFTPASSQVPVNDNTATINFKPHLLQDGDYELIVGGKDRSANTAGNVEYRVGFQVINKPMISNMLNYPNPFTTSTAFVFTITGSEVPQNVRIQIMTITGKIVRDITKDELGPLRIGRNITEFKWDGTDQYGQKLANGIYLYRVLTNLNGKSLDKYKSTDIDNPDNTDKYFNKGYGKMYLMR